LRATATLLTVLALAPAAIAAPAAPKATAAKKAAPSAAPVLGHAVSAAIAEQQAEVAKLSHAQLRAAYAEAQLELARRNQAAGRLAPALAAAQAAAEAFDRQVELHKGLSEQIAPYERARAERTTARELGLARDRANFLVAGLARQLGQDDLAISRYAMVVTSQPDQPLGQDALEALSAMGVAAPLPTPSPKP
jgi:hypothetical protein